MTEVDAEKTQLDLAGETTQVVVSERPNPTQSITLIECPVCGNSNPPSEDYCSDCGFLLGSTPGESAVLAGAVEVGAFVTRDEVRRYPLRLGENTLGRDNADILLADNSVSRLHAKITVDLSGVYVEDLGSTNGTTVAGARLGPGDRVEVADGAEVVFGAAALTYNAPDTPLGEPETHLEPDDQQSQETESGPDEPPETPAVAILVSKDGTMSLALLQGKFAVGRRAGENDLIIADPYCSGRHADVSVDGEAVTVVDIGSTNGTFVNGARLEAGSPREVVPGDEITFGRSVFTIEVPG